MAARKKITKKPARKTSTPGESAHLRKQIHTLLTVSQLVGSMHDYEKLLRLIMKEASETVGAEASSIALYRAKTRTLHFTVALGEKGKAAQEIVVKLGQGIAGTVGQTRKPLNVKDVSKDKRFHQKADKQTGFRTRSILAIPVEHQGKLLGVLEVINKRRGACFTIEDRKMLEIVAGQAGIALENARIYKDLADKHADLIKTHKELLAAEAKLVQAERLSAVGQVANTIVHDLKNPMASVKSFCQLLEKGMLEGEEVKQFSHDIIQEIDHLVDMTRDILDYSRGEYKLNISAVAVGGFLESTLSFMKRTVERRGIEVVTEVGYSGEARMDPDRLRRVILNLCGNAADIMIDGGTLTVRSRQNGDKLRIEIQDSGPGVPVDLRQTLFQPFVTKGKSHGTGLGLAISKKLVNDHGGEIWVESQTQEEGEPTWTKFILELPLC
ncbi:MAG: GAF domain-containing sensor histidine kinase [Candidatus Omnitrophica bacterium]|nr:GAF domain-containing sensor histidine kinase [Candidatus Omnitrophota bacterium]